MRRRISHSLDVVSLVSVYAPTEVNYLTVKDTFYAVLASLVLVSAPGKIIFLSWRISMHHLALIGMVMRHV